MKNGSHYRPEGAQRYREHPCLDAREFWHARHLLVYRVTESGIVEIGRVLHDSMELKTHLPEEYRRSQE